MHSAFLLPSDIGKAMQPSSRIVTVPNLISALRLCLAPLMWWMLYAWTGETSGRRLTALFFFAMAASDGIDGYLARRWGKVSRLGAMLDPVADKLLLSGSLLIMAFVPAVHAVSPIPALLAGASLTKDVLTLSGFLLIWSIHRRLFVHPRRLGKVATLMQCVAVWTALAALEAPEGIRTPSLAAIHGVTLLLTIAALLDYARIAGLVLMGRRNLDELNLLDPQPEPTSSPPL